MDNPPPLAPFTRKRKADTDECQVSDPSSSTSQSSASPEPILTDCSGAPRVSLNAACQSWYASNDEGTNPIPTDEPPAAVWATSSEPPSPVVYEDNCDNPSPAKRPRVDIAGSPPVSPSRRSPRKRLPPSPHRSALRRRRMGDLQDMGLPRSGSPGPTFGSLLRKDIDSFDPSHHQSPTLNLDPASPHIPSPFPLVNRETLKELDLEAILRNPQLRHDLMFDPNLQFRPTSGRRKREIYETYWRAVLKELETGCTCVTFDFDSNPRECICQCHGSPLPASSPGWLVALYPQSAMTLRMPSRIRPLLEELLEVIITVTQPTLPTQPSGLYVPTKAVQAQARQHATQEETLRRAFDLDLIEQELKHKVFDPSGLFRVVGDILKVHCAPMRDRHVDAMVSLAQTCAPGGIGTKADAVKAIRMCFEVLELMKLDIANHQLQTLRSYLATNTPTFEYRIFQDRQKSGQLSVHYTRQWLHTAHRQLLTSQIAVSHPNSPTLLNYATLCRGVQVHFSVLKAMTDLVFHPPCSGPPTPTHDLATSHTRSNHRPSGGPLLVYPETLYLDHSRLLVLSKDAADLAALYMLFLLYRQLIYSDAGARRIKIDDDELVTLKKEIWDIGPPRLGYCFSREWHEKGKAATHRHRPQESPGEGVQNDVEWERWHKSMRDVILQIAMRATAVRLAASSPVAPSRLIPSPPPLPNTTHVTPDERLVKLAERWMDSNLKPGSSLSDLLRDRLCHAVLEAAISKGYPCVFKTGDGFRVVRTSESCDGAGGKVSGLEPMASEIRHLGDRVSRLAIVNLATYAPMYEAEGFLNLES
ncbi:hypothetical protein JAAARDRAFT_30329 [Jaapia argillacea MUCL 33604]|uniref:Tcp11-domain-containing protein n=1 Tax=Jaapia argillacea MUCL 33604 TaxID=933084 RepID=A0A067QG10_9AGAM|nr:hypothetical protein JAAARDRAFT_30329 [Jaapia argillacea MUCL 33604]